MCGTRCRGFTLVELLTVIVVIGVFISVASPQLFDFYHLVQARTDMQNLCSLIRNMQARSQSEREIVNLQGETVEEIAFGFEFPANRYQAITRMFRKNKTTGVWEPDPGGGFEKLRLSEKDTLKLVDPSDETVAKIKEKARITHYETVKILWEDARSTWDETKEGWQVLFNHDGVPTGDGKTPFGTYAVICVEDERSGNLHAITINPVTGVPTHYEL